MLQQVDTPQVLYDNPDNIFVAAFIGSPSMNLYDATLGDRRAVAQARLAGGRPAGIGPWSPARPCAATPARRSWSGCGPSTCPPRADTATGPKLVGDVELIEALGSEQVVHFTIDANRVLAEGAVDKDEAAAVKHGEGVARVGAKVPVKVGDKLTFAVSIEDMKFFDEATGLAIRG